MSLLQQTLSSFKKLVSNYQNTILLKYGHFDNLPNDSYQMTKTPKGYDFWMIHILGKIIKNIQKPSDNT